MTFVPLISQRTPIDPIQTPKKSFQGFTLIELVVAMAVAVILVTVAVPNMRVFIQNGRINTQTNDLIGDLNLARSEAIKRRAVAGMCKSINGTTCAGGGNWRDGRIVFVDINNNNLWDAADTILRFREPLGGVGDSLNANAALVPDTIFFSPTGSPTNVLPGGFFVFCDDRGPTKGKQISLNAMGQVGVGTLPLATCNP